MSYLPRLLSASLPALLAVAGLAGCQRQDAESEPASTQQDDGLVFQTEQTVGLERNGAVVARLPIGRRGNTSEGVHLTKDGRYIYASDGTSLSTIDTRSLERTETPCASPCVNYPLGASLVGRLDAGSPGGAEAEDTEYAAISAVDLAAQDRQPQMLGRVQLAWPHSTQAQTHPYSYFLDATPGQYLFFDFSPGSPANPRGWEHPQTLFLAKLDGTTENLGQYAGFGHESDVWGAISPDGKHAVVSSSSDLTGESAYCDNAPLDLIDTASGQKTQIHPAVPGDGPQSFRVDKAWWGTDGTLYANYQQWPCATDSIQQPSPPPPSVWTYRGGRWSKLDTSGPAVYALQLSGDRMAVVEPASDQKPYETPHGTLSILGTDGSRTHISDGVTAIAAMPSNNAP